MVGRLVPGTSWLCVCFEVNNLLINLVYHTNKNRCVKDVTDMHFLFNRKETFNEDINSWDVSSGKSACIHFEL